MKQQVLVIRDDATWLMKQQSVVLIRDDEASKRLDSASQLSWQVMRGT
jgi:hypothetical protein